ncbi:MAG: YhbY family RNA-binding protein [Acidobacteria bacterium]|nr:YhbY family RNA-binding protein [Acidobacteriota bacterium]
MLSGKERKYLRGKAHALKPSIFVGKEGLSPALEAQIEQTAAQSELLKIRVNSNAPLTAAEVERELAASLAGEIIGRIGRVLIYFLPGRENSRFLPIKEENS